MQLSQSKRPDLAAVITIPEGKAGIVETLKIMRRIVRKEKSALSIRNMAVEIVSGMRGKNWRGEIEAIQQWVKNNIRYVRDVVDVETLHLPTTVLQTKSGDCDDQAILTASLLESIGHPTRFVAIGFAKDDYSHVFTETRLGAVWLSVETTEPVAVGWQVPNAVSRLVIHN